ncbi:efflux RND transporter periplasmic adaptor subunit, partial [Escherichia coli]|nr:efflux RND transporter periplasmic adaptor subunit [Escherichia coli]
MFGRQERLEYSGEDAPKSRRWLWITLAVVVLTGIAAFFMMGKQDGSASKAAAGKGASQQA